MNLILFSFHVKDVGVEGLTRTAYSSNAEDLCKLKKALNASELWGLSTCNRNEYLVAVEDENEMNIENGFEIAPQVRRNLDEILSHLLGVALSRDSVVFGESQILGQFKRSYEKAIELKLISKELSPILNRIIREAKKVRSIVGLKQIHTSVSTVAGSHLEKVISDRSSRILFIGAGETNGILASYLKKRGYENFVWSSRGHSRAVQAAVDFGGEVLNWELVTRSTLPDCSAICVATHAKEYLVDEVGLLNSNAQLVCDLSVPANVDFEVCRRVGIRYFGIDEMNDELNRSAQASQELLQLLDDRIEFSVKEIISELEERIAKKMIADLFQQPKAIETFELDLLLRNKFSNLSELQKNQITEWSKRIVKIHA